MKTNWIWPMLISVLWTTLGCDADPEPLAARCEVYRAGCEKQVECAALVYNHADEVDACIRQACPDPSPFTVLRQDRAELCAKALAATSCDELAVQRRFGFAPILRSFDLDANCTGMFEGARQEGEECVTSIECADGLECVDDMMCPGVCAKAEPACKLGQCPTGNYCNPKTRSCEAYVEVGEACEPNNGVTLFFPVESAQVCVDGAFCQRAGDAYVCAPRLAPGEACANEGPRECVAGYVCGGTCVVAANEGEPARERSLCGEGLFDRDGTCQRQFREGEVCTGHTYACEPGHLCVPERREQCVNDYTCASGFVCCDSGAGGECVPEGAAGTCSEPTGRCRLTNEVYDPISVVGLGEECNLAACGLGLTCSDGERCVPIAEPGETCFSGNFFTLVDVPYVLSNCDGGICDIFATSTCVVPQPLGGVCHADGIAFECRSYLCREGVCVEPEPICEDEEDATAAGMSAAFLDM